MAYMILANSDSEGSGVKANLFCICSPLQTSTSDVFACFVEFSQNYQYITIVGTPGMPIYIMVFARNGIKTSDNEYTIPNTGVLSLTYNQVGFKYYWVKGNISVSEANNGTEYKPANIQFTDDVYSQQLLASIADLLSSLNARVNTGNTRLTSINTAITLLTTALNNFAARNVALLSDIYAKLQLLYVEAQDINVNTSEIYSLLEEYLVNETVPINDPTDAYEDMVEAEQALVVTNQNGETIDAASQVAIAFSEAASGVGQLGDGVTSINGLITDLFSTHWVVIIPVIVALALGLVVTILGKNKSD